MKGVSKMQHEEVTEELFVTCETSHLLRDPVIMVLSLKKLIHSIKLVLGRHLTTPLYICDEWV